MRKTYFCLIVSFGLLSTFLLSACGNGGGSTELLTNGSFETGDLTGWTYAEPPGAAGAITVLDAAVAPLTGATTAGPSEGAWYALGDNGESYAGVLFQYFTVPAGDDEIQLTFDMFVLDLSEDGPIDAGVIAYSGVGNNQHVRVDVLSAVAGTFDTGSSVIQNLYLNVDDYNPVLPYISYSFDLSPDLVAGETYMLRFAQSSTVGYMNMGVDNASVKSK